jgi:hypothetical protein
MKVKFLKVYSARTDTGETRTVAHGSVLDLSPDKAARLIAAGIVMDVSTVIAVWRWFVVSAEDVYQVSAKTPEAWSCHETHRKEAVACIGIDRIAECRVKLENALTALRGDSLPP